MITSSRCSTTNSSASARCTPPPPTPTPIPPPPPRPTPTRSPDNCPSTTTPTRSPPKRRNRRPKRERATPAIPLGLHHHAVRSRPRPVHAAPPPHPRRGRSPDHLVHRPTRPRRDLRRGRRRQDRRRPRRHRHPRRLPARDHLPAEPLSRGPRHAPPHRRRARPTTQLL